MLCQMMKDNTKINVLRSCFKKKFKTFAVENVWQTLVYKPTSEYLPVLEHT